MSKPSDSGSFDTTWASFKFPRNIRCYVIAFVVVLISALVVEYGYLTSLYLVDEVYEVNIPKEITIKDKITIRTVAAENSAALKNFVETYSICQSVYEIQILVPAGKNSVEAENLPGFIYAKTHAKVHVSHINDEHNDDLYHMMLYHDKRIDTDALLMLDADVQISCEDVKFSLTAWQSSQDSIVGFFPRLHRATAVATKGDKFGGDTASVKFEFLDHWSYVWYNKGYSLLLPAGAIVHKKYLGEIRGNKGDSGRKAQLSSNLHGFLDKHPECAELALNVWIASAASGYGEGPENGEQPPIWLDISKSYASSPKYTPKGAYDVAQSLRKRERSTCLTGLAALLGVKRLPVAVYKSVQSKTQLWW